LFTVGFHNRIPIGALLLVTDQPMIPDGVKTNIKDDINSKLFDKKHLLIGIESLKQIINNEDTVRHLKF
jgi:AMP nucleosidase